MSLPLSYVPGSSQVSFITPRNGSLILDHGTVYIISGGKRQGFASKEAFLSLGYSFSQVYPADTSFMFTLPPIETFSQAHPGGTLINDQGTLYVIKNNTKIGIPSMEVFSSWGYWLSEQVPANSFDRALPQGAVLQMRQSTQLNI